jgi:hypothetical protein
MKRGGRYLLHVVKSCMKLCRDPGGKKWQHKMQCRLCEGSAATPSFIKLRYRNLCYMTQPGFPHPPARGLASFEWGC